jgi:hypothetical protein
MLYPSTWLENLMAEDRSDAYVGVRCHKMAFGPNQMLCSYEAWPKDIAWRSQPSHDVFITGCGGAIIYPERIAPSFRDRKKILEICPISDDILLKAAHLAAGIPGYKTKFSFPCLEIPGSEASGLFLANVDQSRNDHQMVIVKRYLK